MKFDFSGAQVFLSYLRGQGSLGDILSHPAYRAVCRHADHWGGSIIDEEAVLNGLKGNDSPFYGLSTVHQNLPEIEKLLAYVQQHSEDWSASAARELEKLLPQEDIKSITVYPIIGYDAGIGLSDSICMSLNCSLYHSNPDEFLSTIVHEGFHVIYERIHGGPRLDSLSTPAQWRSMFLSMLQNEGFAVYAPLDLRQTRNYPILEEHPLRKDYALLQDPAAMVKSIALFQKNLKTITHSPLLSRDEYLSLLFGPERLTYRVGCELIRRVEEAYGYEAVQQAVYLTGTGFYERYEKLLIAP